MTDNIDTEKLIATAEDALVTVRNLLSDLEHTADQAGKDVTAETAKIREVIDQEISRLEKAKRGETEIEAPAETEPVAV